MDVIHLGGDYYIPQSLITAFFVPGSRSTQRLVEAYKTDADKMYMDLTGGKKIKTYVMTDRIMYACKVSKTIILHRLSPPDKNFCTETEEENESDNE